MEWFNYRHTRNRNSEPLRTALADDAFLPGEVPKIVMKCYIQRFSYLDTTDDPKDDKSKLDIESLLITSLFSALLPLVRFRSSHSRLDISLLLESFLQLFHPRL
jgi:hypothetical protein